MERYAELMDAILAEGAGDRASGNQFALAKRLAVPEAVPFLSRVLDGKYAPGAPGGKRHAAVRWALHALEELGPAGLEASPQVERLGELLVLWSIDEPRARAFAAHLHAGTWRGPAGITARHAIARKMVAAGPQQARAHFAELLADTDPEVVRFGLDGVPRDSSCLYELAWETPEHVPAELVRPHAKASNAKLAVAAVRILMVLHRPEDAGAVIDVCARHELERIDVRWLAPHPRSDKLYERLTIRQTFEVVRWRRCANLPANLPEHLRGAERSLHDRDDQQYAPRLDAELAGRVLHPTKIDAADDKFLQMQLHAHDADGGAYGHYARVMLAEGPGSPVFAHAAFQCAWIDRLYGSPISEARVAWLRSVGVRDDVLARDLASTNPRPLAGELAAAEVAPGTQAEALAHLERVWAATR